ncbi:hypothetical protein [Microseira wollei]|uniref:Uncharacterized protein n=1 Tax=Microseira wollei NIES-4236 TaxID=2530354 RepID=A0AAV3XMT7_9CYAN|nr:hypothetical protein [Microseira wollei]GET41984.1 hypothetical protein MiSe_67980 [Microseira wollei NIES-4236]
MGYTATDTSSDLADICDKHEELLRQMGDEISPFPDSKIGVYLSHFRISIEFLREEMAGRIMSVVSPMAIQSVSWGKPFIYEVSSSNHQVQIPVPSNSTLANTISESDFLNRPPKFFQKGKETIWLQILNLDARMDSEIGPIRIILGETLKREHPDIFKPSLGVAQSLGRKGFPAMLFFNPYALIETPLGSFRAIHGTLSYGRVTAFPPVGTPVSICECIPLEHIDEIREMMSSLSLTSVPTSVQTTQPLARIIGLSHPIDMELQVSGEEAFNLVERCIEYGSSDRGS